MPESITSLQNNRVKLVHQLQNKPRVRRTERKIVLEGMRLIRDAIEQKHRPEFLFYEPKHIDWDFIAQLQNKNMALIEVTDEIMQHVTDTQAPQGIIGVFPIPQPKLPKSPQR